MPVSLEGKKSLLTALWEAYEEAASGFPSACKRDCKACCTHNVVATTLEAEAVLAYLEEAGRFDLVRVVTGAGEAQRIRPVLSINALAKCCLDRKEPPNEEAVFDTLPCPLRQEDGCPCYEVRPLNCRCLWSSELCEVDGEAVMNPVLVTINGVFQQIAEHIDVGGLYGNVFDLLSALNHPEIRAGYRLGVSLQPQKTMPGTLASPGFLVPPEHREPVLAALTRLWNKRVGESTFREAMAHARGEKR